LLEKKRLQKNTLFTEPNVHALEVKMNKIPHQEFKLEKGFIRLFKFGVVFFIGMTLMSISLPFLPVENQTGNDVAIFVISGVLTLLFFGFSIFTIKISKDLPFCNVSIDSDGLWYSHMRKESGLIGWSSINKIIERPNLQRLDLIDNAGRKLMTIEYQLSNFEFLRSMLSEIIVENNAKPTIPLVYSAGFFHHAFNAIAVAGFATLGWYISSNESQVVGYGGMGLLICMILYEYLTTVWKLELVSNQLVVSYPLFSSKLKYCEIESVALSDSFQKGVRYPEVLIFQRDKKPIKLKGLKVDATILHAALKSVLSANNNTL